MTGNNNTILQEVGAILMTGPFGQVIVYVDKSQAVKNVAGWFERSWHFRHIPKVEKGRKREPHPASLVGDQRSTAAAEL